MSIVLHLMGCLYNSIRWYPGSYKCCSFSLFVEYSNIIIGVFCTLKLKVKKDSVLYALYDIIFAYLSKLLV